jgi:hypothetical protein
MICGIRDHQESREQDLMFLRSAESRRKGKDIKRSGQGSLGRSLNVASEDNGRGMMGVVICE